MDTVSRGGDRLLWRRRNSQAARVRDVDAPKHTYRIEALNSVRDRALLVDLNNFSSFPTYAVGLLVAGLRNSGFEAEVLVPLAHDVPAGVRERRETLVDHLVRKARHMSWRPLWELREGLRIVSQRVARRMDVRILVEAERAVERGARVILLSAYTQHLDIVREIGAMAARRRIPLLVGGAVFNQPEVAAAWCRLPGITAIVGAECDLTIGAIVQTAVAGGDLLAFDGVTLPDGRSSPPARPLHALDAAPLPDFSDFPWDRYPHRVIPLMTGRGCQWRKCVFCSDVVTASGLGYRSRSVESVLHEMREQSRRHSTEKFLFLDIKLNSNPAMFRGIIEGVQRFVPGAEWIGTIHVDQRKDNGLSRRDLRAAAVAGMRRISFGLESGSQRLLDAMDKGCTIEGNAAFVRNASEAGLSVRCTMMQGFPGETAEDLDLSSAFLERHAAHIDRIRLSRFSAPAGTPVYARKKSDALYHPEMRVTQWDDLQGHARYVNAEQSSRSYRRAKARLLSIIYDINRREIRSAARAFDGMM